MSPPPREIKGGRPPPLKVHKALSFSSSSSSIAAAVVASSCQPQQRRHHQPPVIIYTHSPKVIHTNARDFMALVQKLTGLTRSTEDNHSSSANSRDGLRDDKSYSSAKCSSFLNDVHGGGSSSLSGTAISPLRLELPPAPLPDPIVLSEMAVFMPSSSELFCSATNPFYRFPDQSSVLSPGIPNLDDIMNSYNNEF